MTIILTVHVLCDVLVDSVLKIDWEKSANEIKISNIISAVNEEIKALNCKKESKKGCNSKTTKCITHNLWDQLDQHINNFFEKVKLQDLVKKNPNT